MQLSSEDVYDMGRVLAAKLPPRDPVKIDVTVDVPDVVVNMCGIESQLETLTDSIKADAVCEQIAVLRQAVMALSDYMPELQPLVDAVSGLNMTSIHNEVDSRPELSNIAVALQKIAAEMHTSRTEVAKISVAIDKQTEVLAREKSVIYVDGKITKIK